MWLQKCLTNYHAQHTCCAMLMHLWARAEAKAVGVETFHRSITAGFSLSSKSLWFQSMTLNIPAVHLFAPAQGVRVTVEREVRCDLAESSRPI